MPSSAAASRRVIYAALFGNGLIAITKFIATGITGSSAMFSEAVHSVADTGNQVLLLYGLRQAARPPDDRFPFGYGKEVYFWTFVVAILIFAVGAGVSIVEGTRRLLEPRPIEHAIVNYVVLSLAMVFEGAAWWVAFREFRRTKGQWSYVEAVQRGKDPSVFVVLFEDSAAMLGLMVAMAGIALAQATGILWFDGLASILIGVILAATAAWLAYETKGLLIGEAANPRVIEGVRALAAADPDVEQVHEVLTMHVGPEFILLNVSVKFRAERRTQDLEATIARLDEAIKQAFPRVKRVFIEAERRPGVLPGA
jgi:cation diffusion facilitator family transporter